MLAETIRPESPVSDMNVEVRDQALMGGIATLIARRLKAGGTAGLRELLPDLVELASRPTSAAGRPAASPWKRCLKPKSLLTKNLDLHS
jgi:hypothetical protein